MCLRVIFLSVLLFLYGCAQTALSPAPIPEPEHKVSAVIPQKKISPPQIVILTSEDIPAYSEVAQALAKQLGTRGTIVYLSASQVENLKTIEKLKSEEHTQVVSIGLNAAIAAKGLTRNQVIFCQVYNYQDYALLSPRHKGISMLPSFAKTFGIVHSIAPLIKHIGVISGPGFSGVMRTAQKAAQARGIVLYHETVNTDKEYQYAYKNMSKKVQGYWLLPDNRVLSEHILRDIMTFSIRNSKPVIVFNDELLKLGGLLSISSDYTDTAHQAIERLDHAQAQASIPGPSIVYQDKMNLRINSVMAHRLNIAIPAQYRKYENVP